MGEFEIVAAVAHDQEAIALGAIEPDFVKVGEGAAMRAAEFGGDALNMQGIGRGQGLLFEDAEGELEGLGNHAGAGSDAQGDAADGGGTSREGVLLRKLECILHYGDLVH